MDKQGFTVTGGQTLELAVAASTLLAMLTACVGLLLLTT
jgi:hypothetical protein